MLVIEERAAIDAASVLFASLGQVLVCADVDGRIVFAPESWRELRGRTVAEVFGPAVDVAMRGEHRESLQTVRGPVTVAPFESEEELGLEGVRFVLAFRAEKVSGEPDRIRIALEANRWRREDAARALGISRATLWRKMRELGLL